MTITSSKTTIEVRPLSGHTGAELFGVDLSQPLDSETVSDIRSALLKWGVVFLRDQAITPGQHVEFARLFGTVTPAHPLIPGLEGHPEILVVSDRKRHREAQESTGRPTLSEHDDNNWHVDVTFVPNPPFASILRSVVAPPDGGDTRFSNVVVADDTLSKPIRDLVDNLHAEHENTLPPNALGNATDVKAQFAAKSYRTVHPVVRVHPETGERAIYVNMNFTRRIIELSRLESDNLLNFLYDHIANPAFAARFRWEDNSIAFWDNRKVAHIAPGDLGHLEFDRVMHRITLAGDTPFGPDGAPSTVVDGDLFT
jgi:alpha-ketoglutarate-dependent taurine dioxygenase